mmetsp:Transcript_39494/g.105982  ORF Transcript_39494/g.105982 Transcript_39494/m.105982 type:complete len:230 (-) Transcript_39494:14-703(-)
MASPRTFTSRRPSSKLMTPAAQRAVYSPKDRPAMTEQRSTASALSARSFSTPARPPMNIAGWQYLVSSSFSSGPLRQSSRTSQPSISLDFCNMSFTFGMSFTSANILTYWEPWPGNRIPMGSVPPSPSCGLGRAAGTLLVLTASSFWGSTGVIQPSGGPVPSASLYLRRSPLSSSSCISDPVDRRVESCGDARPSPSLTRMPPLPTPPTTSHIGDAMSGDGASRRACHV